jgi:hypothetical protein
MTESKKYSGLQSNIFGEFIVVLVDAEQDIGLKPREAGEGRYLPPD